MRQAQVGLELADQWLDARHLVREVVELLGAAIEQAIALEKVAAAGQVGLGDGVGLTLELVAEHRCGLARELRGPRIDDDEDRFLQVREMLDELLVGLARGQIRGDQTEVVGVDAEIQRGVDAQHHGQGEDRDGHGPRARVHPIDPARQRLRQS